MMSMILFSQYLKNVGVPFVVYSRGGRGWAVTRFYLFRLFPVLLTILFMWSICAILTYASQPVTYANGTVAYSETAPLGQTDAARTDLKTNLIRKSLWFRHPYPCTLLASKMSKMLSPSSRF